ncbi:MAG: hypothetical protein FJY97_04885 [candidate division Zixibacteria bacterium]|nr:hypothetical protein [candidate division Zixibacteria bacterium]
MIALACALLALGVVAFLISPLLDGRRRQLGRSLDTEDLNKRKDFLYMAIRELNIDYQMGKLNREDYQKLQTEYMQEVSSVLDGIERKANGREYVTARIENEVLEIRRRRAALPSSAARVETPAAVEDRIA